MLDEARLLSSASRFEAARGRATAALERFTAMRAELDLERARNFLAQLELQACEKDGHPVD
jgi:hypothetical protein